VVATKHDFRLDGFLRLPEAEPRLEHENGRVTQTVSPRGKRGATRAHLADLVLPGFEPALDGVFAALRVD